MDNRSNQIPIPIPFQIFMSKKPNKIYKVSNIKNLYKSLFQFWGQLCQTLSIKSIGELVCSTIVPNTSQNRFLISQTYLPEIQFELSNSQITFNKQMRKDHHISSNMFICYIKSYIESISLLVCKKYLPNQVIDNSKHFIFRTKKQYFTIIPIWTQSHSPLYRKKWARNISILIQHWLVFWINLISSLFNK